jgi:hypothetical protein
MNLHNLYLLIYLLIFISYFISYFITSNTQPKVNLKVNLNLTDFTQIKIISDDTWNNFPNSDIRIDYYDKINNDKYAGYISYRVKVGQIGLFVLQPEYRNRGLGTQILLDVIDDMKNHNTSYVWAVTIKNHPFWSNVFNKSFYWYDENVHPSVTGSGYKMKI